MNTVRTTFDNVCAAATATYLIWVGIGLAVTFLSWVSLLTVDESFRWISAASVPGLSLRVGLDLWCVLLAAIVIVLTPWGQLQSQASSLRSRGAGAALGLLLVGFAIYYPALVLSGYAPVLGPRPNSLMGTLVLSALILGCLQAARLLIRVRKAR